MKYWHVKTGFMLMLLVSFYSVSLNAETNIEAKEEVIVNPFEKLLLPSANAEKLRRIQIKRITSADENKLYMACIAVLQDMGFNIDKRDQLLGFARGAKNRKAEAPAQELTINILNLMAILSGNQPASYEKDQTITAMFVITPAYTGRRNEFEVRITFHRFLRQPFRIQAEVLDNPELYKSFFSLLDKAIFLKEHKL
ncbi:MAG: hypothetical protein OEY78_04470 [Gammaproteobacteria bacterium]|nr:hypothetical protein [Gammaproteobacteria bacterium]